MAEKKLHAAVLFSGRGECEVSLISAHSVLSVLDPARYEVTQISMYSSRTDCDRMSRTYRSQE
ncbi:MAG: hypothetical protein JW730_15030 [Anaerolineales bacterium]|nr:hypothetical protein [Anaerolineales bacterium]